MEKSILNKLVNVGVVGLASNDQPQSNVKRAQEWLVKEFVVKGWSPFVETEAVACRNQAAFLNGAALVETNLSFELFKARLKAIEQALGRKKTEEAITNRFVIDLDLLVWNGEVVHSDFYERSFIKEEVLALLPNLSVNI